MSWLSSIFAAIVTGALGAVVSGYFANLIVRWYRVSGFEGGSSWFVAMYTVFGLIAGLVIGLVIARMVASSTHPSVLNALLYSCIVVLSIGGLIGGTARLLADIPPTIDDEPLMLHVEARWPATRTESPATVPGFAYLDLGSSTWFRRQEPTRGALWKEDAHKVDGLWTVSGAAPMSTSRGAPVIEIALNQTDRVSFTLPKLAHPTANDSVWSTWYPTEGRGGAVRTNGVTYRYRVLKQLEPVRTEHIGNFAVSAIVSYFKPVDIKEMSTSDFYGSFRMTYLDKPVGTDSQPNANETSTSAGSVALLPGAHPLLLATINGEWTLLSDDDGTLHVQRVSDATRTDPAELTNDPVRMAETRSPRDPRGRVDRTTYARSHMLLFDHAVLNVETREVHTFTAKSTASAVPSVPPLGVSPGAQSFVRFVMGTVDNAGEYAPLLAVTDFIRNTVYELPIDRSLMRYGTLDGLNAEWLAHYFIWKRDANGVERLEPQTDAIPISYSGVFLKDTNGRSTYQFSSGGQRVRQVLAEFLRTEFHAIGDTSNEEAHAWELAIGDDLVSVETPGHKDSYVRLSLVGGSASNDLVTRVGKAFNEALATGKYDSAFQSP